MDFKWHPDESPPTIESHSKAKLRVLREYLEAYFNTLNVNYAQEQFKIDLVDGFSGGGSFLDDGQIISGSPLILIEEAEAAAMVAELERKVHDGINAERAAMRGLRQLQWDDRLNVIARDHSEDMTERGYFAHDTPEGLGPTERATKAGYSCRKGYSYGLAENITVELMSNDMDKLAAAAVQSWVGSPGHRANLLGRQYDRTGVGASFGKWKGYKAVYLTQVFC